MAVTVSFFKSAKLYLGNASLNLNTADLRAIPLTSVYTFSQAHDFANDLTGEVTTNGGTRVALTTKTWALSGNNGRYDSDDIAWTATGGSLTIRQFALADYTGSTSDADRELICLVANDADLTAGDSTQIKFLTPSGLFEIQ